MKYTLSLMTAALALSATEPNYSNTSKSQSSPSLPVAESCRSDFIKTNGVTYSAYGEFLYMQPNGTELYYGASAIGITPGLPFLASIASPNWTILEINPDYHPGFEVGVSFLMNDANMEIAANYEWLHCSDTASFQASNAAGHMVGSFFDIGPNASSYKIANGKARFSFDAANLMFAKQRCFFDNFHTRYYGAASFVRIMQNLNSTYSNVSGTISRILDTSSTFTAGGPQMGLDYDYRIHQGFFFSGSSVFSLFVGQMKGTATYQSYTPELAAIGVGQPNNQATTIPNRVQLVPAFEQKLGFSYLAIWNSVRANFEIGYRCQIYFDAVQSFNMASQVLPAGATFTADVGMFAVAFEQNNSNFMLTGPYATVGVDF